MCAVALEPPATHPGAAEVISEERGSNKRCLQQPVLQTEPAEEDGPREAEPEVDIDLTQYDPPIALSSELSDIEFETIKLVVVSSLEHVTQQVRAEKHRAEAALAVTTGDPHPEAGDEQDGSKGKGKDAVTATGDDSASQTGRDSLVGSQDGSQGSAAEKPGRPQWRRRLGLRRMFRQNKGEPTSFAISRLPVHLHGVPPPSAAAANPSPSGPPSLTQLIYKHVKQTAVPSSPAQTIECVSCFDDITPKEAVKTPCHYYCRDCFQQLVTTAIGNEAQWPPKCCLNPVPFRTIAKHVGPELLRQYREKEEELAIPAGERVYCSAPDCGQWIKQYDKARKTAGCSRGHRFCVMCRGDPHPETVFCPQDRDRQMADRLADEEGWRRCFKCTVLVEHKEACQHMTCRCGAQFCYVCGKVWRTCHCTSEQLNSIKQRAAARRKEREAEESEQEVWLRDTLRKIEEFEREMKRRGEEAQAAESARRAERRAERAAEKLRREQARLVALEVKHEELRGILARVNSLQRELLHRTHRLEGEEAVAQATTRRNVLSLKQSEERTNLQRKMTEDIKERESAWDREYRARVAWEKQLEDEYATALQDVWAAKSARDREQADHALRAFLAQNDAGWEAWQRRRDGDIERFLYLTAEEYAIRHEAMSVMRQRLEDTLATLASERERKHATERAWFELVVAERARLLAEIYSVERENGGEDVEDSDDEEVDANILDDASSI